MFLLCVVMFGVLNVTPLFLYKSLNERYVDENNF